MIEADELQSPIGRNFRTMAISHMRLSVCVVPLLFCGLVASIGVLTNAWFRNLNSDEATYYAPAIDFVSRALPRLPLDYPFPAPPLGLWLQGILNLVEKGFADVRFFSTACAIALSTYLSQRHFQRSYKLAAVRSFPCSRFHSFYGMRSR